MKLSDMIREYREEHNLSQRQFAALTGLSNGYISMIEKEKNPKTQKPISPTIDQLKKIADGMGITLQDLFIEADDIPVDISEHPSEFDEGRISLLESYDKLNQEGREQLLRLADDMVRSGRYALVPGKKFA